MYDSIKERLEKLVDNRNYYFKNTTKSDADYYLKRRNTFIGIDEAEITALENKLECSFPADFRLYLKEFGHNCGELFCLGQDLDISKLIQYQEWGKELLFENEITDFIKPDTIFFEFHQGYAFSCFHSDDNGETCIYRYVEGNDDQPKKWFSSFNEMLNDEVEKLERISRDLNESEGHFVIISAGYVSHEYPAENEGISPKEIGDTYIEEVKTKNISFFRKLISKFIKS